MTIESTSTSLLTIPSSRLESIAFHSVGIQTEGGSTPYTGPANAGGASGISIGVMQHDFGQSKNLTLAYAEAIVNWHSETNTTLSITSATIAAALSASPTSGLLTTSMRGAIASFGASKQGAEWIFRNFDQGHVTTAVLAAQQAFSTPYGQAVLSEGTHIEEFAAFAMKIRNQYGPGKEDANGTVKSPGFGALMDYLQEGSVKLFDSQHPGQTTTVTAAHPDEFNRQDLLSFARAYTNTRSKLNEAVYSGPVRALDSGALYGAILDSDSPLSDVLKRVETKGDFSPALVSSDPDVALTRAMFGSDTGRMKSAVAAINDATTLDPVSVSATLGQYPGTLWIDPLSGRIALSYKDSSSGFVVDAKGYAKFASSAVVKDDGVRTLLIGEGDAAVGFDQIATPLANSPLPREVATTPPIGHWEERLIYTDVGLPLTTQMVWVHGPAVVNVEPANSSPQSTFPSTNHTTTGAIYLSRDGASATLPDGQVINAGRGGRLELGIDGNLSVMRPVTGYNSEECVYSVTLYNKSGQAVANTQIQVVADPAHPNDPAYSTTVVQGQIRDVTQIQPDGSEFIVRTVFQTGTGWVEQGTGEIVQTMVQWTRERLALAAVPQSDSNLNPMLDPNGLTPSERIQQSYEQETQRLFNTHLNEEASAAAGSRTLSIEELRAFDAGLAEAAAARPGAHYADAGSYADNTVVSDGGSGTDLPLNVADIPASDLVRHFIDGHGTGQLAGFDVLLFNENSSFLVDTSGNIAAEINRLPSGYYQVKDLGGNAVYVSANDGSVLTQGKYEQAQTQAQNAVQAAQANQAATAVGLMNSIIGLQHWDNMSDLQRTAAVASIYNAVNKISGDALPGDLGTAASVLGLLNALDRGDVGSLLVSSISLVNTLADDMASEAIRSALSMDAADVVPGLGLVLALDSGDPMAVLAAAANFIPVYGQFISIAISVFGSMFGDDDPPDIPTREGLAHAQWDAAGNTVVITDQDIEGGGPTATGWMTSLVDGLQTQLAGMRDASGNPYALAPDLLPAVGFRYDPDGFNLANGAKGFVYLKWTDENGQTQTRYYDGAGSRGDGSGETLAGDFMQHAAGAIAPAWQVQTVLAHYQQGQGIHLPNSEASLPQELADGIHQTLQALTLALPVESALQNSLIDIDGDGYLERTQWLATNQQVLGVDANGDGLIGTSELLSLNGPAALNSLNWLDANGDHILNARDPAFPALRLWMDVNADADSAGETETMVQAGIVAIDFGSNPPAIVRADGSRTSLTIQALTGDVLGVKYQAVEGGVLQLDEQQTGPAVATLHAVNTREFDGQADHMHGGDAAADGETSGESTVDAGDDRLVTTTANTVATLTIQTSATLAANDPRLRTGTAGAVLAGQGAGQAPGSPQVSSNRIVFVPAGAASPGAQMREATQAMVRSADAGSLMPLMALALGAGATQWPTVAIAATPPQASDDPDVPVPSSTTASIDWQTWGGTRFSAAPNSSTLQTTGDTPNISSGLTGQADANFYASDLPPAQVDHAQAAINSIANEVPLTPASTTPSAPDNDVLPDGGMAPMPQTGALPTTTVLDSPQTHGEQATSREDAGLRFLETLLLANDSTVNAPAYPDQPSLRITSVFAPVHGSVSLQVNAQGATEVVFLSEANYHGPASFDYTVTDQYGLSNNARMTLSIAAVNDAPVSQGETASGSEDATLLFTAASLMANDSDVDTAVDGDLLRITRVGLAQHGQVFLQPDGTVRFEPDADYNGPAQFSYWVGDRDSAGIAAGTGYETQATVKLTVLAVNDLPVVTGEIMDSDEDIILNINPALLLANDTDVDTATTNAESAQVLSITAVGNAQHGSIALLPDGTLQFIPELNYFGAAGFSYTVDDGHGGQVQGQVVVNLAPVNDAPDVLGETVTFNEDELQTFTQAQFLVNDSDVDNPHIDLRIVSVENATHGAVSLNPDGSIRFAPDADYFGPAQFTYTVSDGSGGFTVGLASLDIAAVNDAPRLVGEALALDEDTEAHIAVEALLANDADVDNLHSDLAITAAGNASHGSVQVVAGEVVFTPDLNYNGAASFTYTVIDGAGGESQATVSLTFNPVNDAPVANSELVWGKQGVSYTLTQAALLANDTDVETPAALHVSAISNVQHGTAVLNADGSVRFTPDAGYTGRGSFDYVVQDPEGAGSTATAQIDFSRVNVNPTATDDSFTGYEDIPFSITQAQLLVNDSDADNAAADLRVTAVAGALHGAVSLQPDGSVRFVPTAGYNGAASFSYQVRDGDGGQTWASAHLTVQAVNDAPVIEDIWYGLPFYGYAWQLDVVAGDTEGTFALTSAWEPMSFETLVRDFLADADPANDPRTMDGQAITWSYYQNGHLRPTGFNSLDADGNIFLGGARGVDDPYRQNGGIVAYDPDGDSNAISLSIVSTPQHGHAWVNQFLPAAAPGGIDHTQAVDYLLNGTTYGGPGTGLWQFMSQRGDPYSGADPFTIAVTDAGGATTYVTLNTTHLGSIAPVALDLDGNGLQYVGLADSNAYFDVDQSGKTQHLAWVAASDGLLARDIGADGQINRIDEISFTGYLAGAKTDLEGLVAFDSNGNHLLDAEDDKWKEFGAWQDKNGNGISEAGEFRSLDEIGITQIGLQSDQQARQAAQGVTELGQSRLTWADGHTGAVGDVAFAVDGSTPVLVATSAISAPAPEAATATVPAGPSLSDAPPVQADLRTNDQIAQDASDAQLMRMALLFNQMVNTADAEAHAPLGFVPIVPDTQWHDLALAAEQHAQLQTSGV